MLPANFLRYDSRVVVRDDHMAEHLLGAADWRGFGREQFPQRSWSVDGDVLHAIAQGERVDLISRERFGDFALLFDWRLPRAGSSAIICRVQEEAGPKRSREIRSTRSPCAMACSTSP